MMKNWIYIAWYRNRELLCKHSSHKTKSHLKKKHSFDYTAFKIIYICILIYVFTYIYGYKCFRSPVDSYRSLWFLFYCVVLLILAMWFLGKKCQENLLNNILSLWLEAFGFTDSCCSGKKKSFFQYIYPECSMTGSVFALCIFSDEFCTSLGKGMCLFSFSTTIIW